MSPERYQKMRAVLAKRQLDLTVCLELVHKTHNLSAIMRTCDAVGIHNVHVVWEEKARLRRGTSMGSQNWVFNKDHNDIKQAVTKLKAQNMQVLVAHLSDTALDYRDIDYTKPTAIIFGQEKYGATEQAVALADQDIQVPMVGMVQSLNVSVAAALILYEAQAQRQRANMYDRPQLSEVECQRILFANGYPRLFEIWQRRSLAAPLIDECGQINANEEWWKAMRHE